jgi:hypothetical protein
MTYRSTIKRIDNCSQERVESISRSLSKLQKLRNSQHTSNEAKQYKKFQNPKSSFPEKVYQSSLNNLAKRSLMPIEEIKMKNVFNNSVSPNNLKAVANAKNYLESKAMYNIHKLEASKAFNKKPAAGVACQRLSPVGNIVVAH